MANRLQYTIGLNVNANPAKAAISSLQQSLVKISALTMKISVDDSDIQAASDAATQLQVHLQKAINQDTGKLDLSRFVSSLRNAGTSVDKLGNDLMRCGKDGAEAFAQLVTAIGQSEAPIKNTNRLINNLATTLKNTVKWQLSSNLIHGLQGAIQHAISYAEDLNGSLNDIRIVTGKSADEMVRFAEKANKAAQELNTTTKKYTDASLIYYQQGDNDKTVEEKTALTIKAANVAFSASTKEMSEMLTAVWNSYKVGSNELEKYIDIMAALGATTATSTEEIATGMTKVASTANAVGVTMEQMSSIIATVSSVTRQSAESIGTAYKTILARMQDLKMGETLDDGVTLGKVSGQLEAIGVSVLDASGNLRDMGSVIEELGAKWETLSKAQQVAIAEVVAGKRQYTQLYALMENMDKYQANLQTAQGSEGTLEKQADIYAESWQAAHDKVTANLESIYSQLLNDKGLVTITKGLAGIVSEVSNIIEAFGGLKGIITTIGAIALQVFSNKINASITQLIKNAQERLMSLTQSGREQLFEKSQAQTKKAMDSVTDSAYVTESQRQRITVTKQVMDMEAELGQKAKNLSQEQISGIQAVIAAYKQEQEVVIQAQKKKEDALEQELKTRREIELQVMKRQAQSDKSLTGDQFGPAITNTGFSDIAIGGRGKIQENTARADAKNTMQEAGMGSPDLKNVQQVVDAYGQVSEKQEAIKAALTEIDTLTATWGEKGEHTSQSFEQMGETLKTQVNAAFGEGTEKAEELNAKIDQMVQNKDFSGLSEITKKFMEAQLNLDNILDKLKQILIVNGKLSKGEIDKICASIKNTSAATADLNKKNQDGSKRLKDFKSKVNETNKSFTSMAMKASAVAFSLIQMWNGAKNVVNTLGDSGKSVVDKFFAVLTLLPPILTAASAAEDIYAKMKAKSTAADAANTVGKGANTVATNAQTAANYALQTSMIVILAIMIALVAIFMVYQAITNATKKAEEERTKTQEKLAEQAKQEVENLKKEREEVEKTYDAWVLYDNERAETNEATSEYVSATEAVLEALGKEEYKVYLTMQRYDDLAKKIKQANKERIAASADQATKAYKDTVNSSLGLGRKISRDKADDYGWANTTIDNVDTRDGKVTLVWAGKNLFQDNLDEANKGRSAGNKLDRAKVIQTARDAGLNLRRSGWGGFGDIQMNGINEEDFIKFKKQWDAARKKIQELYDWDIESTATGQAVKDYITRFVDPILEARKEKGIAVGTSMLQDKYGDILGGEGGAEWYSKVENQDAMQAYIKQYLTGLGLDESEAEELAQEIIAEYIDSFGTGFTDALNKAKVGKIGETTLKTYTESHKIDYDAVIAYLRDELHLTEEQIQEYLGYLTDVHEITGKTAEEVAKIIYSRGKIKSATADFISKDLPQLLEDAKSTVGTDEIESIEYLFKQYYGDAYQEYWDKFLMMSEAAQKEELGKMAKSAPSYVADRMAAQQVEAQDLLQGAQDNVVSTVGHIVDDFAPWYVQMAKNFGLDVFGTYNDFYDEDGKFKIDDAISLRGYMADTQAALQKEIDETQSKIDNGDYADDDELAELKKKLQDRKTNLEIITSRLAELDSVIQMYTDVFSAASTKTLTTAKSSFKFNPTEDFTTLSEIVGKNYGDYTTEDWALLTGMNFQTYDQMDQIHAGEDELAWKKRLIGKGRYWRQNYAVTQEEYDAKAATDAGYAERFKEHGGTIISNQEAASYDRKLRTMEFNAELEAGNATIKAAEATGTTAQTNLGYLENIDVTKLPEQGTQAWENMSTAIEGANLEVSKFVDENTTAVERIKQIGEARKKYYGDQVAALDSEIAELERLKAEAEAAEDTEQVEDLQERIDEKRTERNNAQLNLENVDTETAASVNTQLKTEYNELNKELTEVIKNADSVYKKLNGIKLDEAPKKGTQAYNELAKAIAGAYDSVEDFLSASREEQIKFLGEKKGESLLEEVNNYGSLLEDARKKRAEAAASGADKDALEEWDTKIADLEQKRADALDAYATNETAWRNELAKYYQNAIKLLEQEEKETATELTKREKRISVLAKNVTSSRLSLADQQGQTGIENWGTMTEQERMKLVMGQYTQAVNDELTLRDKKIGRYGAAKAELKKTGAKSLTYLMEHSSGAVSKEAFTNILSNMDLTPEMKGVLENAWDKAIAGLSIDEFNKLSWSEVGALLEEALEEATQNAEDDCAETVAAIKDQMLAMYKTLSEKELKLAQDAVKAWETAFKKIAAFRKSILMGEDISEELTNSLDDFITYADAYTGSEGSLLEAYKKGTLKSTDMKLGTADELIAKERRANGLDTLFSRNANGIFAAKGRNDVGASFGINRGDKQFWTDGKFDSAAYDTAVQNAVNPYLQQLLQTAGYDDTEITKIIADYWAGVPSAVTTITEAGKKVDKYADEWAHLVEDEEKIAEAKAKRDEVQTEQEKIYTKANDRFTITQDLRTGRDASSITQLTNDVDRREYLAEANKALVAAGYTPMATLDEMASWDVTDNRWDVISNYFSDGATEAKRLIVEAGQEFKGIVTEMGYGDTAQGKEASEWVETAETDLATTENSYQASTENTMQGVLDRTSTRQSAISTAINLESTATTEERINAAQALREAYADADEATRSWAESMADAVEAGEDLTAQNKALTSANLRVGKSYNAMTKQQRLQYRQMLKTNKVTVDGYKTLDEYFDALDAGAEVYDSIMSAANKFEDQGIDAVTTVLGEDMDEATEGFQAGTENMESLLTELLPDMFDEVAPQLLQLSQKYSGDVNAALCDGWDSTIGAFDANTTALLTAMGFSADQIIAMQDETRQRIEEGAAIGDIDFLSMMADMDVDPTQFDSMITALNNAMHQIQAMLEKNGMKLDPPWTDIPTLGSKGVGKGKGGSGSTGKKDSSSGGGGSSAKKVQSYKKGEDEKERYHEITKQLDQQAKVLSKIDKLKERAFGANKLKAINDEIKALEKENELYAKQAKEAEVNAAANKKILEGYGATFNDDGTVNYDEYMDKILADYNAAVDKYNSSEQKAGDELALKEAEEIYNEAKKALSNYEEDMNKIADSQDAMLERQNKISAAMLEGIQYKVEIKMDLNDREIKRLQYFRDKWEDLYDMQDESLRYMTREAELYTDNMKSLENEMNNIQAAYDSGTLTQADYAAGMQDVNDKMLEQLNNLLTIKKSIKEAYQNTLEKADQELEKHTAVLSHSREVMQSYIQMQQLMGLGADYSGMKEMYQVSLESSRASLEAARQHVDTLKQSREEILKSVEQYGWTDELKQQYDDVNEHIREGENNLNSALQQSLEDAQSKFTNTMNAIVQSFDETLFGMKGGLAKLEDDYAYYQEEQSRYLSTSKELYEVSKLNREINQSISGATTSASKERLKALQEEINAQSKKNQLTEYDVNMMQLQYQHALALQELEDAKNAKSTVRLTRDENGNYGYQYTADEDQIDAANQKVEDALQEINELAANRVAEMEQAAVQAEREYRDSLLEIAQDTTLTLEERQDKMDELTRRHTETMKYYQEQYGNAQSALLENQKYVYDRYGVSITENTGRIQDQMNDAVASMIAKTDEYAKSLSDQMKPGGQIYEAMQAYKEDIEVVQATSGLGGWSGMTANVDDYRKANEEANKAIKDIEDTLGETLTNVNDVTNAWSAQADVLDALVTKYENVAKAAEDAVRAAAGNVDDEDVNATEGAVTEQDLANAEKQWMYIWGADGFSGTWSGYDSRKAAIAGAKADIQQKIMSTLQAGETDEETASNKAKLEESVKKAMGTIQVNQYKRGGLIDYTGPAWVDGSLNEPEMVLNSGDTDKLLAAVDLAQSIDGEMVKGIFELMHATTMAMFSRMNEYQASTIALQSEPLEQNVHIEAEFPNVTEKNEIVDAFNDLVNMASQYANRTIR